MAEKLLLNIFGSPDIREIDGLGGATSQTSKAAIIGPPSRPDADVDYSFAQVVVDHPTVDWGGNCGNISSAVGPYAINSGLVRAVEPITTVRVHNTNTAKIILEHVPVVGGRAASSGRLPDPRRSRPGRPDPARVLESWRVGDGQAPADGQPEGHRDDRGRTLVHGLDRRRGESGGLPVGRGAGRRSHDPAAGPRGERRGDGRARRGPVDRGRMAGPGRRPPGCNAPFARPAEGRLRGPAPGVPELGR